MSQVVVWVQSVVYLQRVCDYQYYYDAAHTQPSGWCVGACYPGGAHCDGVITEYSVRVACDYCGC